MKARAGGTGILDFAVYGAAIDNTPELELADPKGNSADHRTC